MPDFLSYLRVLLLPFSLVACQLSACFDTRPTPWMPASDRDAEVPPGTDLLTQSCRQPRIRFSEVLYDPDGPDGRGDREFIEWLGDPGADTTGHRLRLINGADSRTYAEVPLSFRLRQDGLAITGGASVQSDQPLSAVLQNGPDRAELIRDCDGAIIDAVAWPGDATNLTEGLSMGRCAGDSAWRAMRPSPGIINAASPECATFSAQDVDHVDAGTPDGGNPDAGLAGDTDSGGMTDALTEQLDSAFMDSRTDGTEDACQRSAAHWRIHEVLYDPEGADTPVAEFVELRWQSDTPPLPTSLRLRHLDGADLATLWDRAFVTPDNVGTFVVESTPLDIGGGRDTTATLPLLQNGPDRLQLIDCDGQVIDDVAWSGRSGSMSPDAASARSGESIARCVDESSPDHDRFGAAHPSRGHPATTFVDRRFCSAPCEADDTTSARFIAGFYADPVGSDEGAEWVVIGGEPDTATGALTLEHLGPDTDTPRWIASLNGRFDAIHGEHVLGGQRVIPRDTPLPGALLNRVGRLRLLDCRGQLVDAVDWGSAEATLSAAASGCYLRRVDDAAQWQRCCGVSAAPITCENLATP